MAALKHPARHYIHFLFSRRIYDIKATVDVLDAMDLPVPKTGNDLDAFVRQAKATRARMQFPALFNPGTARPNAETLKFLQQWGITDAWRDSGFLLQAIDILLLPNVRSTLEMLILSPMSNIGIARRLVSRFELPDHVMNAGVVRAYKHYFWDLNAMNLAEWRTFLLTHFGESGAFDMIATLQTPRSKTGLAHALSIIDKDPRLLGPADRYEIASAAGFQRFMTHAFSDSNSRDTYAAFTALNIMRMADEELSKYRGGSADLIEELRRIQTIYDPGKPPTLKNASFLQPMLAINTEGEEIPHE